MWVGGHFLDDRAQYERQRELNAKRPCGCCISDHHADDPCPMRGGAITGECADDEAVVALLELMEGKCSEQS